MNRKSMMIVLAFMLCVFVPIFAWSDVSFTGKTGKTTIIGGTGSTTMITPAGDGCSTPTGADLVNEGFEAAGGDYEDGSWTEVGSPDGIAAAPGTPPSGGCTYAFHVIVANNEEYTYRDLGAAYDSLWVPMYVYVDSVGIGDWYNIATFGSNADPTVLNSCGITLWNNGGQLQIKASGASATTYVNISAQAYHFLELFISDESDGTFEVDGGGADTFDAQTWDVQFIHIGAPNNVDSGDTGGIWFDIVQADDDGSL